VEPDKNTSHVHAQGLEPVPYVVVELPGGKLVLRHPDELQAVPGGVPNPPNAPKHP